MTYGVYDEETKQLYTFDTYYAAFKGYTMLLVDEMRSCTEIPKKYSIVYINDEGKIYQKRQFEFIDTLVFNEDPT